MYVCVCNALTERHVAGLLDQDVRTPSRDSFDVAEPMLRVHKPSFINRVNRE
jgi:hypothetical protein